MSNPLPTNTPDNTPALPPFKINIDYLAPVLSAIVAGIIHHACREGKQITLTDVLLIISPSVPVICQVFIKILTFIINSVFQYDITKWFKKNEENVIVENKDDKKDIVVPKDGKIIKYLNFSTTLTPSEKIIEWQEKGYSIKIFGKKSWGDNGGLQTYLIQIIRYFTNIQSDGHDYFYHEFMIKEYLYFIYIFEGDVYYATNNPNLKINSDWTDYIYTNLYPETYTENTSKYRISRVYNEYSQEIMETIKKYKKNLGKIVNLCFLFSGKPGTCKTYICRAIAAELSRKIVEVNLKTILYEDDFFEIFVKNDPLKTVFLFDEIDLMCLSREFDDSVLKGLEMERLQKLNINQQNDINSTNDPITSIDTNLISLIKDDIINITQKLNKLDKIEEKIDILLMFQTFVKNILLFIMEVLLLLLTMGGTYSKVRSAFLKYSGIQIMSPDDYILHVYSSSTYLHTINHSFNGPQKNILTNLDGNNDLIDGLKRQPFTLRTLLNFISGGTTPDGLCICATTNNKDKLDPALMRPGRLRLFEFKYLRKCDAVCMIYEDYPEIDKNVISDMLDKIGYKDYMASGALLSSILSSTISLEQLFNIFEREIKITDEK